MKFVYTMAAIWLAIFVGWVMNLIDVIQIATHNGPMGAMFVLRCIGIVAFPIGGIVGYF